MTQESTAGHYPRLGSDFFQGSTTQVARRLLGKLLVRRTAAGCRLSGIVVEVEAYLGEADAASHSYRGRGKKNASMFLPPGRLYVYPIHARHCLNVVTEPRDCGAAVLIRAIEPWEGIAQMAERRELLAPGEPLPWPVAGQALTMLGTGPARLCQALGVDRQLDGIDLANSESLWLEEGPPAVERTWQTRQSGRIGLSQAAELPLRWFIDGQQYVSGCARDHSRGRWWSFGSPLQ